MDARSTESRSRHPRFPAPDDTDIGAWIAEAKPGLPYVPARLVDLSLGGAKLRVPFPVPVESPILLSLESPTSDFHFAVAGLVRWIRPDTDQHWILGCAFFPPLTNEALETLSQRGAIDRGKYVRQPIRGEAFAEWKQTSQIQPVRLINISEGGFCILSADEGMPGDRLRLVLENTHNERQLIDAVAQWVEKSDEGYFIGCEFAPQQGFRRMQAILWPDAIRSRRKRRLSLFALAGVIGFLALALAVAAGKQ